MKPMVTRWSSQAVQDRWTVSNPATGEPIAVVQGGGSHELDGAVRAARHAFETTWRDTPGAERGRRLRAISAALRDRAEEIAALETSENGKPLDQSRRDVQAAIGSFDYFGSLAGKLPGDFFDGGPIYGASVLEPYGVIGAILPFNWPPIHTAGKAAPALAAGNTIVIKPPEQTPLTVLAIAGIMAAELPADVVQVVPGVGAAVGQALAAHPMVGKLSFTGATVTGVEVVRAAAANTTPVLLELGGKNAMIVLADADLDAVVKTIVEAAFYNQGEACTAISRVIVARPLHDQLVEGLGASVAMLVVGDGRDEGTHVGPVISAVHRDRVQGFVDRAITDGACVSAQAALPKAAGLRGGHFVAPTLITDVRPEMEIAREEVFGPVLVVLPFDDVDEAVRIANDTAYGLTACVHTADQTAGWRIARRLDVGIVFLNNYFRGVGGMPFGGTKASGYGREHTIETLKEYGRVKLISLPSGATPIPQWEAITDVGL